MRKRIRKVKREEQGESWEGQRKREGKIRTRNRNGFDRNKERWMD